MSAVSWRPPLASRHSGVSRVSSSVRRERTALAKVTPPALNVEVRLLSELARAHEDVRASIQVALFATAARVPDLVTLRGELRRRLDQLFETLVACSDEKQAIDALVPFVFLVDEQVECALLDASVPGDCSWPQLQRDLFSQARAEGGDVFFERAQELLAEQPPRPFVVAAYLFCLKANFQGRLADEPDGTVEEWVDQLSALLPRRVSDRAVRASSWRSPRRAVMYVAFGVGAFVAWHLIVFTWAYLG